MSLLTKIERIQRVHDLIRRKSTGTPDVFARRLSISESTLYQLLSDLKSLGAPIQYCRSRESYEYGYSVNLNFGFAAVTYLNDRAELQRIHAGSMLLNMSEAPEGSLLRPQFPFIYYNPIVSSNTNAQRCNGITA